MDQNKRRLIFVHINGCIVCHRNCTFFCCGVSKFDNLCFFCCTGKTPSDSSKFLSSYEKRSLSSVDVCLFSLVALRMQGSPFASNCSGCRNHFPDLSLICGMPHLITCSQSTALCRRFFSGVSFAENLRALRLP